MIGIIVALSATEHHAERGEREEFVSDEGLRELERQFRHTQAPEDKVAWYRALKQQGRVTLEQLELAGACGDKTAFSISGSRPIVGERFSREHIETLIRYHKNLRFVIAFICLHEALKARSWNTTLKNLMEETLYILAESIQDGMCRTENRERAKSVLDRTPRNQLSHSGELIIIRTTGMILEGWSTSSNNVNRLSKMLLLCRNEATHCGVQNIQSILASTLIQYALGFWKGYREYLPR